MSGSAAGRIRKLSWWLDDAIALPGGYRIGYDGLIGLLPGLGDIAGLLASGYLLLQARKFGTPPIVMLRMVGNVTLEALVGTVPLVGDLFDLAFKANRRNVALMEDYLQAENRTRRTSWLWVVLAGTIVLAAIGGAMWLAIALVSWLFGLIL